MSLPELTRSPPTEATTPPAHCIKPTKHMANYVAATGDFAAPFDAVKNAVLPSNKYFIYPTQSNTLNNADTINNYSPKKSPEPAPGHFQRIPTASTPEQESAVISRYLALAHQECLQLKNKTANLACKSSNEVGSAKMGWSHTIYKAPGTIICNAASKLPKDITSKILFSPIITRKGNLLFASNARPTKKQRVSNDFNKEDIKNKDNNEVATCDSFKIPAKNAEDLHNNKRGIKTSEIKRALKCSLPFQNPTITRKEIIENVEPIKEFTQNAHFTTVRNDDDPNKNFVDAINTNKERALECDLTHLNPQRTDEERAETVTANENNNHGTKRKFLLESTSEFAPESPAEVNLLRGTMVTQLSTNSEEVFRIHCANSPENDIHFYPHCINAVIRNGTIIFPGTHPVTNSRRPRSILLATPSFENTDNHDDARNSPVPDDEIGPMSDRDPNVQNAVNLNFSDDIFDNSFDIVNMSANASIYSQPTQSSR